MSEYPSITKFMATKLITFSPDTEIQSAIRTMLRRKISGAPVLNEKGDLVGMLSEVDCLKILIRGPYSDEPTDMGTVADFMSPNVTVISADKTILDAAYKFVNSGLKRLPVVEKGKLIGQISRVDVLRAIEKIKPAIKHTPDSWKGRVPFLPKHKSNRYSENS